MTTVDLSAIAAGDGGFKIIGEDAGDNAGYAVSSAGDVNGDGFADIIIGADGDNTGGNYAGAAYVIFGKASGFGTVDLGTIAAGTGGFKIIGENAYDLVGRPVASAGDVNGDGFDDLILGATDSGNYFYGAAYVIFGKASGFGTIDLDTIAAGSPAGFKISGEASGDFAGYSVASAGDINGDGFDDVIVGAPDESTEGFSAGAAYVIFGKGSGFANIDLTSIAAGVGGFKIFGQNFFDRAGWSVASAGDVNGDGFDDIIVGAYNNKQGGAYAGAAYVIFGKASGFANVNLDTIAAGNGGFKIFGETAYDAAGYSVAHGDVNGDGFDDVIVSAIYNDAEGAAPAPMSSSARRAASPTSISTRLPPARRPALKSSARTRVTLPGTPSPRPATSTVTASTTSSSGPPENDAAGYYAGATYLIFGKASGFANINLDDIVNDPSLGIKIVGEATATTPAPSFRPATSTATASPTSSSAPAATMPAAQRRRRVRHLRLGGHQRNGRILIGTDGKDTLMGGTGDDTLDGGAGKDNLKGGDGDDVFLVRGEEAATDSFDGGKGTDTIRNDSAADVAFSKFKPKGVEVFDNTGTDLLDHAILGTTGNDKLIFTGLTLLGVTRIDGLAGNDTLTGNDEANVIVGGDGNDTVDGAACYYA
ncbi:MAG: FG-GAP-like repeat-containing protein [Hyphomicrobiales bacterium]